MSRVIPEEGDKGRGEPAPDHHQGPAELSTRRWYRRQPYPTRPDNSMGRIKKWPLPRIIVIDSSHIADFPCHSFNRSLVIANRHLPRIPHTSEASPSTGATSPIFIGSRHDRLIHCLAPSRPMAPSSPARPWPQAGHLKLLIVLKIVHSDQVLEKQTKKPFFTQAIGLTPVPQAINIRPVSTRQAIPP